jgi:hypothetical protein
MAGKAAMPMSEAMLIKWGWFLWNCDKCRYPVTWREFELAIRSPYPLDHKWMTNLLIVEIDPPPAYPASLK